MNCQAVFVYGTLQPGEINAHYFQEFKGSWKKGYVLGNLEEEGWGAEHGFPGIRLDQHGIRVKGSLFKTEEIDTILKLLDALEGADYQRAITKVHLDDGTNEDAYIYELAPA